MDELQSTPEIPSRPARRQPRRSFAPREQEQLERVSSLPMLLTVGDAARLLRTTNRRVYAIDAEGAVVATERDDHGVLAIAPGAFAAELAGIRQRFGDKPVLLSLIHI